MRASRHAVILAGGRGTRMGSLTDRTPKPLLPLAGEPIVLHQLRWLAAAGIADVTLAAAYRAADFDAVVETARAELGLAVRALDEGEPRGTGGGLRHACPELEADEGVVVVNGDLVTGHDLRTQLARFAAPDAPQAVVHVREVDDARPYGCVVVRGGSGADADRVTAFLEKSPDPPARTVNAGTVVLSGRAVARVPVEGVVSLERDVYPALVADGGVVAHRESAYFADVGTPAALAATSADVVRFGFPPTPASTPVRESWCHHAARVAPDAVLTGGTSVLAGATVGAGARLEGVLVLEGARVAPGAVLAGVVVAP